MRPPVAARGPKPDNVIEFEGGVVVTFTEPDPRIDEAIERWLVSLLDEPDESGGGS